VQCLFAAACIASASANSTLYFIDVSSILCGSQGEVQIDIALDTIPASQQGDPHILTFFRTSTNAVTLQYNLTDSSTPENQTLDSANVTLRGLNTSSARRLLDNGEEEGNNVEVGSVDETAGLDEGESDVTVEQGDGDGARGRRLGGFRRRSSSFSSPRRRSSSSSSSSSSSAGATPATSPAAGAGSFGQHRRRAAPAAGPATAPAAPASRWGNPQTPGGSSYGYASTSALNHNYGGRAPASTGYGYSGAGAYRGGSGAQIAMAAGAGVLAGVGASYAWSKLHNLMGSLGEECWAGDQHYKSCAECRLKHSPASDCAGHFTPKVDLARDDLMNSGFVPANVTGPLRLIITGVMGVDFTPEMLCPPSNWTDNISSNVSGNVSGNFSALFVTLTRLASSPAVEEVDPAASHGRSALHFVALVVIAACCCAGCVVCGMFRMRSSDDDLSKHGPQMPFPAPAGHNPAGGQFSAQWPGVQFQQQPYPVAFQPGHPQYPLPQQYRPGQPAVMQAPGY